MAELVATAVRLEDNVLVVEAIKHLKQEPVDEDELSEVNGAELSQGLSEEEEEEEEVDRKPSVRALELSLDDSSRPVSVSESDGQGKRARPSGGGGGGGNRKKFKCKQCDKEFNHRSTLSRHKHTIHNPSAPIFICDHCNKVYKTKNSLIRHLKKLESGANRGRGRSALLVKCAVCDFTANKGEIISHYETDHEARMDREERTFSSFDEFLVWKNQIETETVSRFVKIRQDRLVKDGTVESFYRCHRDGYYKPRGKHLRNLKRIGSNKINGHCPAKMQVLIKKHEVSVVFVKTHVGHDMELSRIALTKEERDAIARQLALQVPFDQILDEVKTDVVNGEGESNVKRVNLLTRKDLYNIETSYSLTKVTHRNCIGMNVENWVQEMIAEHFDSFIRFYKPQGRDLEGNPEFDTEEFHLVLMNDPMVNIMRCSGDNYVCLDACTLVNDFVLVTLMILDENDQAFPCCFLITNNYGSSVLEIMFNTIKDVCNYAFTPRLFMSNLEDSFYKAWTNVMGSPRFRIYSPWVVEMDWRGNLIRIDGEEKQEEVFAKLMSLSREKNIQSFEEELYAVHKKLESNPITTDFAEFFDVYRSRASSWAHCFRAHISPSIIEQLELIQRSIRIIQTTREKKILRLDKYVFNLMSTVKEQMFDNLLFTSPDLLEAQASEMKRRHDLASAFKDCVIGKKTKHWAVHCEGGVIFKIHSSKACKCNQICSSCGVCSHAYVCSCVDSSIKWITCEHVHAVCIKMKSSRSSNQPNKSGSGAAKNRVILTREADEAMDMEMSMQEEIIHEDESNVIINIPESTYQYLTIPDPDGGEEGVVLAFEPGDLEGHEELVLTYADPEECSEQVEEVKIDEGEEIVIDTEELPMDSTVEERRSLLMQKCQAILSRISSEAQAAAFEQAMSTIETDVPFEQN